MRGVEQNRKKHGWAWGAILLALLLVAYPLSLGPAIMLVGATGTHRDPFWFGAFQLVYGPLAFMPAPIDNVLQRWGELWDVYGEFH
jgi:hypothetical protein